MSWIKCVTCSKNTAQLTSAFCLAERCVKRGRQHLQWGMNEANCTFHSRVGSCLLKEDLSRNFWPFMMFICSTCFYNVVFFPMCMCHPQTAFAGSRTWTQKCRTATECWSIIEYVHKTNAIIQFLLLYLFLMLLFSVC